MWNDAVFENGALGCAAPCPIVRLFPFDASPISGQDVRIKKRHIV